MSPVVGMQASLEATLAFEAIVDAIIEFQCTFGGQQTTPSPAEQQQLRAGLTRLLNEGRPGARLVACARLTQFLERRLHRILDPQFVQDAIDAYRHALEEAPLT